MTPEFIKECDDLIDRALGEDLPGGDLTTRLLFPAGVSARAELIARGTAVVAGLPIFHRVFEKVDPKIRVEASIQDGDRVVNGEGVAVLAGDGRSLLAAERTALNFLQRLSGIATLTARFVDAAADTPVEIYDTRKTTPGLRHLEKYAVRIGGGRNHRIHLADGVLVKDNHLALLGFPASTLPADLKRRAGGISVEIEAKTLEEVEAALSIGADIVLLDNMTPELIREAVARIGGKAIVEISGGVTLENIRELAVCGAQRISIGALTHSAPAIDFSLEISRI